MCKVQPISEVSARCAFLADAAGVARVAFVDASGGFVNRESWRNGGVRMYTISRSAESPPGRCSYPDYINQDSEGPREALQVHAARARRHNADWKLRRQLFVRLRKARGRARGGGRFAGALKLTSESFALPRRPTPRRS